MSRDIPLDQIQPNKGQPRQHFNPDALNELADSIRHNGLITPILVRPIGEDQFEIVHGERRWRAHQIIEAETIRAEVRELSDEEAYMFSLIENIQRDDLTPLDEAEAYTRLLETGLTQTQVGEIIGKSQSYIAQKLRLKRLPPGAYEYIADGTLTEGHGRQLLRLKNLYPDDLPERPVAEQENTPADFAAFYDTRFTHAQVEAYPPTHLIAMKLDQRQQERVVGAHVQLTENQDSIAQWEIAAYWWAAISDWASLSVGDLSTLMSQWYDRYRSALVFCQINRELIWPEEKERNNGAEIKMVSLQKQIEDAYENREWFALEMALHIRGAHADGAASYSVFKDYAPPLEYTTWVVQQGSFVLPSRLQEWGPDFEMWQEAEIAEGMAFVGNDWQLRSLKSES